MEQLVLDLGLAPMPTLANFVPDGNEPAWEHLRLWTQARPRAPLPIYLWGPAGSGKTHLLRAVAQSLLGRGESVGWLGAEVTCPSPFDERWSAVLLDDVQLYTAAQQAAAFNWFVNAQSPAVGPQRAVLACGDRPPADLPLREDLRSRLGWGHVFQLQPLDEPARRAVLRRAADARGIALSDEVMDFMLNRFARDLSSLMALLDRLDGYALRTQRAITIPLVRAMLAAE
ncbi:DnaA regulatory inactivator Hda [Tepidimonas sp.]|uniref:DnaA regulatory inactivator Hda n=1 Tax=Tepidimonas sp. TaxID=2002775 RepID=UPI00391891D4